MSSMDFNTPSRRVTLIAIGAVVGLHMLTAMALVAIKPSAPVDRVVDILPPIEIQMVTLPADVQEPKLVEPKDLQPEVLEVPVEITEKVEPELVSKITPTPVIESKPKDKPMPKNKPSEPLEPAKPTPERKSEPKLEPLPKTDTEPKPIEKEVLPVETKKSEQKKPEPIKPSQELLSTQDTMVVEKAAEKVVKKATEKTVETEAVSMSNHIAAAQAIAEQQRQMIATQNAQRAAEEAAQAKAVQEAVIREKQAAAASKAAEAAEKAAQEKAKAEQQAQAARDAKAAEKAQAEAQAKADAKAKADAEKAEAASNTPMNFSASSANWSSKPNFSFPDRAARGANSGDTFNLVLLLRVNKQGGIDSVSLAQSSGNAILDREAQRQVRSGKFRPFMNSGTPVVGNVTLPVSYAVP